MKKIILALLPIITILFVSSMQINAQQTALSSFNTNSRTTYYNTNFAVVAQRFTISTPVEIKSIAFKLLPKENIGNFRLRIFANEGSLSAPLVCDDIIDPIVIMNDSNKSEFRVTLDKPVKITSNQFFIAFDHTSDQFKLLSDTYRILPDCEDSTSGVYSSQYFMAKDSIWSYGYYSFCITVNIKQENATVPEVFQDITAKSIENDTLYYNKSIASDDINNDGYNDLLFDGRLYLNDGGIFREITKSAGIVGYPSANLFIDVNNDGLTDIFFVNVKESGGKSVVYINNGNNTFDEFDVEMPNNYEPRSFALGDVNNDGYTDICFTPSEFANVQNSKALLMLNLKNKIGFQQVALQSDIDLKNATCQFSDIDEDADQDLIIQPRNSGELYYVNQNGKLVAKQNADNLNIGDSIAYLNNSFLFFNLNQSDDLKQLTAKSFENPKTNLPKSELDNFICRQVNACSMEGIQFENNVSSIKSADFDNNGYEDIILFSDLPCHFTKLYFQNPSNSFDNKTLTSGFSKQVVGPDAVISDIDEDGFQDIISTQDNFLKVFKNQASHERKSVKISFKNQTKFQTGSEIESFSSNSRRVYHYYNGGGLLTQCPPEISIGMGENAAIDSVRIINGNNRKDTLVLYNLDGDRKYYIKDYIHDADIQEAGIKCEAFPSPFKDDFNLIVTLSSACDLTIDIFDLNGNLMYQVARGDFFNRGVHQFHVKFGDFKEKSSSNGIYIYKIMTSTNQFIAGRLIKIN